ncbi:MULTISPECIES: MoaD/ThiS family protein [Kosmotoga]|uniref:ThiamineS protein n=1 Tax=Kosmotoga olearia (strain ATCC BAA-1733 / DSM 21960 / TBF 19.5.1) TaxID=521045 RepID=C5CE29_KOSOT|nr:MULTISPECIES: MoaD/ThiS family protein [Kosmotoga]ACR80131.1 thiamineS protein [Kosmotoga olearia TBF 19.5.1]MDI3523734.1 sulfur carrier protein [Kosmotoga sp.]MDK2953206.1 sulfur carrier protein [Kosmotoga sp.]OAA20321.1 hypothetical protein DU53_07955 [Kosmotoga sp. DU53]
MIVKFDDKTYQFDKRMTVRRLLEELRLNPEAHIVIVDGQIKTPDIVISETSEVRIVRAVSGG